MVRGNSQPEGDKGSKDAASSVERSENKTEDKERRQAAKELNSGTLNDQEKQILQQKRESGRSRATGFGKNADGSGGLASAESIFGDAKEQNSLRLAWRDTEFKAKGWNPDGLQGERLKPDNDGYHERLNRWRERSENYHRDIAQQLKDATHGYTLPEFFRGRTTAISDVYQHSLDLREGASGKSPTLEDAVARLQDCPWADKIRIKFDGSVKKPTYDEQNSTITINPNDSIAKQVETFVHEAYHASHQALAGRYGSDCAVTKDKFVRLMTKIEAQSFESEIRAHDELSSTLPGATPVTFKWTDLNGVPQPTKDLGDLYHKEGLEGLYRFVIDEAKTRMDIKGKTMLATYRQYYVSCYGEYHSAFDAAKKQYQEWFANDPSARKKIEERNF